MSSISARGRITIPFRPTTVSKRATRLMVNGRHCDTTHEDEAEGVRRCKRWLWKKPKALACLVFLCISEMKPTILT